MRKILFFLICATLATVSVSAQKRYHGGPYNPRHTYLPGEWYTPDTTIACVECLPGFYPVNNIIGPTQFGCKIKKCVKAGRKKLVPKGVPEKTKPDTCTVNNYDQSVHNTYNYSDTTINNNDNRSYLTVNEVCCDKVGFKIRAVARSRWFGEASLLLPTDHSYKAVTPIFRLGYEIEGHFENMPGLRLNFQANVVTIPGAFQYDPNCPSCVPQEVNEFNIGGQARVSLDWHVTKKMVLRGYVRTDTWNPFKREVKAGPDQGLGAELQWGKGPLKIFAGGVKSYTGNFSGYGGLKIQAFEKLNARPIYQPSEKLSSRASEKRDSVRLVHLQRKQFVADSLLQRKQFLADSLHKAEERQDSLTVATFAADPDSLLRLLEVDTILYVVDTTNVKSVWFINLPTREQRLAKKFEETKQMVLEDIVAFKLNAAQISLGNVQNYRTSMLESVRKLELSSRRYRELRDQIAKRVAKKQPKVK